MVVQSKTFVAETILLNGEDALRCGDRTLARSFIALAETTDALGAIAVAKILSDQLAGILPTPRLQLPRVA